ncbi:AAA family ATPase [Methylobacterium sp. J-090]|uniref:AAA family ATPase n=1 Tax=Methylobacterium sp. J-090 TaxID=2836666 RepID=UPI001FBB60FF|nr:AAA family ATPase [Methylobacterium sp. J-090]MCJ2080257.1 ATP-binding protein [Methylobacterium sp. J-090]
MMVRKFRLQNFGPFVDSGWICLSDTMNIFVGENNSGKSAVLRSFGENFPHVRHRSSKEWRAEYLPIPVHSVEVDYAGSDLDWVLRRYAQNGVGWIFADASLNTQERVENFAQKALAEPSSSIVVKRHAGGFEPFETPDPTVAVNSLILKFHEGAWIVQGSGGMPAKDGIPALITWVWQENVFFFQALRASPGKMGFGAPGKLDQNASNLAIQLNGLQGDRPEVFAKLVSHLVSIFPTVGNLSVSPADGMLEIRVWSTREQQRREFSFSLDDSGTGLAQAIAILFVAMTYDSAVLVIDEISSYLHPAAAKALLRILQSDYPQHQYVISTHSPDILSAGRDAKVFWIRKSGFESSITEVDLTDLKVLRDVTGQLGVSMTDVFAAEHIVWVDGETEEACFPMLLAQSKDDTRSVLFIPLLHTGDFHDRKVRADKVFQIYERLTGATAPVVSKVAFNFDADDLSPEKQLELQTRSGGRIHFLPRRNLESYLIHPSAIARVIAAELEHVKPVSVVQLKAEVERVLLELSAERRYGAPADPPTFSDEAWLVRVDGAKLIADLFLRVTESTLEYRKTTHSVSLVRDLLQNEPNLLKELTDYVVELVLVAKRQILDCHACLN